MRCVRDGRRSSPQQRNAQRSNAGLHSVSLLKQAGPAVEAAAAAFQDVWQRGTRNELATAPRSLCGLGPGLDARGRRLAGRLAAGPVN